MKPNTGGGGDIMGFLLGKECAGDGVQGRNVCKHGVNDTGDQESYRDLFVYNYNGTCAHKCAQAVCHFAHYI
jgi:hypothetical protein